MRKDAVTVVRIQQVSTIKDFIFLLEVVGVQLPASLSALLGEGS